MPATHYHSGHNYHTTLTAAHSPHHTSTLTCMIDFELSRARPTYLDQERGPVRCCCREERRCSALEESCGDWVCRSPRALAAWEYSFCTACSELASRRACTSSRHKQEKKAAHYTLRLLPRAFSHARPMPATALVSSPPLLLSLSHSQPPATEVALTSLAWYVVNPRGTSQLQSGSEQAKGGVPAWSAFFGSQSWHWAGFTPCLHTPCRFL